MILSTTAINTIADGLNSLLKTTGITDAHRVVAAMDEITTGIQQDKTTADRVAQIKVAAEKVAAEKTAAEKTAAE